MSRYTELTDYVFHQILHYSGDDDDMKEVSAIIHIHICMYRDQHEKHGVQLFMPPQHA